MSRKPTRTITVLLALLAMLWVAGRASAQVNDGARIFSADAVTQANGIISELRQRRQKDFLIETFASIPQDAGGGAEKGSKPFFHDWANKQAQRNHVNGIYSLVSMDPRHIETVVGNKTEADGFSAADRDKLTQLLVQNFKNQQYDDGLLAAVRFASERLEATSAKGAGGYAAQPSGGGGSSDAPYTKSLPSPRGAGGFSFGGLICVGVVILVVIMLVRAFTRSRGGGYGQGGNPSGPMQGGGNYGAGYGPQYGGGGSGGGFGRGLLGGLLGGAIGSWGYDRLSHGGGNTASGGDASQGTGGLGGGSDVDTSYSSGGSDFGSSDSGGGADFGSSDSGGGGGGDSGSSGGDF